MQKKIFKVNPRCPSRRVLKEAAKAIRDGKLVVFPTETVYGIAASLESPSALRRLCRIKKRPRNKPFTVHIHSIGQLKKFGCKPGKKITTILKKHWPGPLTAILKGKRKKIGFRIPDNKVALELLKCAKVAVVAPSANISGEKAPSSINGVPTSIKRKVAVILNSGRTKLKVASTVVDFTGLRPKIIRRGSLDIL